MIVIKNNALQYTKKLLQKFCVPVQTLNGENGQVWGVLFMGELFARYLLWPTC